MTNRRNLLELLVLASCAFVVSGAITTLTLTPGATVLEGNAIGQAILGISYLAVGAMLVRYHRETLFLVRRNWTLLAMVILAFSSCLWAEAPAFTFRRSVAVAGTTLLGIALAVRLPLESQLRMLSWVYRIISVLSIACVVLLPSYGISSSGEQGWRGVLSYKNAFGSVMATSVLVEWQLPVSTRFSRILNWLALLLSAVSLLFSRSITPLLALAGAFLLIEIYKFAELRLRMPLYATGLVVLLIFSLGWTLYVSNAEAIMVALGRTSNFTGRAEIWSWVLSFILERPILGYGYSGFWNATAASKAAERALGAFTMYSHNGYLESLLTLGVVGFLLAVAYLAIGLKRAYYWSKHGPSPTSLWPLAFLLFFLLYNLGECTIFLQDLQWGIGVATVAASDPALSALGADQEDFLEPGEELA